MPQATFEGSPPSGRLLSRESGARALIAPGTSLWSLVDTKGTRASDHIDFFRGAAAVAVLLYHVRYRFFLDYQDISAPSVLARAFYLATAFGHDAVMVFFVLSGFLVSRSVLASHVAGTWSWTHYLASRFSRLYVVLLPAVAITVGLDSFGIALFGSHVVYSGEGQGWQHDFFDVNSRLTLPVLAGNLFFLQTILVPPVGSNEALWSLSFEFWYYMIFPVLWIALCVGYAWVSRLFAFGLVICALYAVGPSIAVYFDVWLLGTVLAVVPRPSRTRLSSIATILSLMLFVSATMATHLRGVRMLLGDSTLLADYVVGFTFALFLFWMSSDPTPSSGGRYHRAARRLSSCSYTLYAIQLPILVLLRGAVTPDYPWLPSVGNIVMAIGIGCAVLVLSDLLARRTEAYTGVVRAWLERGFTSRMV